MNSIYHYPTNMVFFTTPELLEIGDIPFTTASPKPTRLEALEYYRRVAEHYELDIRQYEWVKTITGEDNDFQITTTNRYDAIHDYSAKKIVLATGYYDLSNKLNVPGEDLAKVFHYYREPHPYFDTDVVVIGGNGSQTGSYMLSQLGVHVVGIPSTIDNDLFGTDITIGCDTAINVTLGAIDHLRTTGSSHNRAFLVETMGRDCGYLAIMAGLAGGAEVISIPEFEVPASEIAQRLRAAFERGKTHAIVVIAEGVKENAECERERERLDHQCAAREECRENADHDQGSRCYNPCACAEPGDRGIFRGLSVCVGLAHSSDEEHFVIH